jgi:hypothetical protein
MYLSREEWDKTDTFAKAYDFYLNQVNDNIRRVAHARTVQNIKNDVVNLTASDPEFESYIENMGVTLFPNYFKLRTAIMNNDNARTAALVDKYVRYYEIGHAAAIGPDGNAAAATANNAATADALRINIAIAAATQAMTKIIPALKELRWMFVNKDVESPPEKEEYGFTMEANGDVSIVHNGAKVTSYHHINVTPDKVLECGDDHCRQFKLLLRGIKVADLTTYEPNTFFAPNMPKQQRLAESHAILKYYGWVKNKKQDNIMLPADLTPEMRATGTEAHNSLLKMEFLERAIVADAPLVFTDTEIHRLIEDCIKTVHEHPKIMNLLPNQNFDLSSQRRNVFSRLSKKQISEIQAANMASPLNNLQAGGNITLGNYGKQSSVMEGGRSGGSPCPSHCADTFASCLNRLVSVLNAKGRMLTPETYNSFKRKIADMRVLEEDLKDITEKLEKFNTFGNGSVRDVDMGVLNNLNTITNKLRGRMMTINTGIQTLRIKLDDPAPTPSGLVSM